MDPDETRQLKDDIDAALLTLQSALRNFARATKTRPTFILDHRGPEFRPEALTSCKVWPSRMNMLVDLAKGPVGAEVGVQAGILSRFILDEVVSVEELHLFDNNRAQCAEDVLDDPRTVFHQGDSSRQLRRLQDVRFDWIYVDADHSYAGALKDARAAEERLKPGGVLFFNDYCNWSCMEAIPYGVMTVVHEMVAEGWDMVGVALAPHGFHDVALRRSGG